MRFPKIRLANHDGPEICCGETAGLPRGAYERPRHGNRHEDTAVPRLGETQPTRRDPDIRETTIQNPPEQ